MPHLATEETSFILMYGADAVLPSKVTHGSYQVHHYDVIKNEESMQEHLDLLEEKWKQKRLRMLGC